MAKEIEVGVKVTGLSDLKRQLKETKDEIIAIQSADIIDQGKLQAAQTRAGQLKDALNDVNEQIAVMSGGSGFEKVSNGLGLIGSQLSNLDFEGAANSAKMLTSTIQGMNPKEVAAGFKGMITTVAQLGKAFMTMGLQLLQHPIFLLVAVVVAIVAAIILLKDKLVIAQKAFDMMMMPINLLIDGLKKLSDWLGITQFEMEETAEASLKANEKMADSSKKRQGQLEKEYERRINLMKAEGKDTTALEIEKTKVTQTESAKRVTSANKEIAKQRELLDGQTKEQQKATKEKIDKLREERDTDLEINKDAANGVKTIIATKNKEIADKEQKAREEKSKKNAEAYEKEKQDLQRQKDALKSLEQKYADEIESLGDKTEEDRLQTQKAREQRELDALKKKGLNTTKAQQELDEKYSILSTNLEQSKVDKLKEITDGYNREILLIKDKSKQTQLAQDEINALAEIDKITTDETKKEEAKKAVREKYALLKREADALTFEKENTEELEKSENEALSFEKRYAIVDEREKLLTANTKLNDEERKRIAKENADARNAIADAEFNAKQAMFSAISQLAGLASDELGKSTVAGKAFAVAAATIDTYAAIAGQLKAFSGKAVPGYAIAQAIATGAMGLVQVKKIISTKVPGKSGGGGSAPTISGMSGGGSSAPATPALGLTGNTTQFNQTSAGQAREAQVQPTFTVRAVVSETEVTDTQNRVGRMRTNAEL